MIRLEHVSKQYGQLLALDDVSITFPSGKTTVLIGPSGCGKSTLLRLVNGLIVPSSGSVMFDGQELTQANLLGLRRRMGYVIQDGGLFPHLSARRNITLLADHLQQPRIEIEKRLSQLCDLAHFDKTMLEQFPAQLSGGQRQRVSLMRALMLDPEVLLLDEPLAALDPMVRAYLQEDLRRIFNELGKTVILVTHDLPEAAYFADTIVLMNQGRVVQTGGIKDLQSEPASGFVTTFVAAQRNLTIA